MKTHIYILFFILLFNKINTQTGYDSLKSKVYKLNNFITSIEFGPQYCYRSMSGSSQYRYVAIKWDAADAGFPKPAIYYDKKNDKPGIGWIAGLYGNFKIYKGLRIKFGLSYENFRYSTGLIDTLYIKYSETYFHPEKIDKKVKNTSMSYEYNSVSLIPIELKYYFKLSQKLYLNLGVGASFSLMFSGYERRVGVYGFSNVDNKSMKRNNNASLKAFGNIGVNYFFRKHTGLSFETFFLRSATNNEIYRNINETIHLYSIGGKVGVIF